jgi:hypothetical protein
MLNEAANFGIEHAPVIGVIAGYAGGLMLDANARAQIAATREELLGAHKGAKDMATLPSIPAIATTTLALFGAAAGFAAGETIQSHDSRLVAKPAVKEPIDHSFQTPATRKTIDKTAILVWRNKKFETEAIISHNADHTTYKNVRELKSDVPYGGPQKLPDVTTSAIDSAFFDSSASRIERNQSSTKPNSAVVVVTNGNSIGDPNNVIDYAKTRNVPVFIANADDNSSNTKNLKLIANKTGGQYFDIPQQAKKLEAAVEQSVSSHVTTVSDDGERLPWGITAAGLTVASALRFIRRRRAATGENPIA